MIDINNVIFLLGGHDLEMITIRDLLDEQNIEYFDESQKWGAKLSDYSQRLEENAKNQFYAVELTVDDKSLLDKYNIEIVDHHNEYSDRDASLLQVLKQLKIEPSREHKLIAANDSRYISGMRSLCATKNEIENIRTKDKKAQGIKKEDEELAMKAINVAKSNKPNPTIIFFSKTKHFATITDRIHDDYSEYIIHNDTKIVFYGYALTTIKEFLKEQNIDESSYYYGGGDFGFLGLKDEVLDLDKIKALLKRFKVYLEGEKVIHSYHTFMLPFVFEDTFDNGDKKWEYKEFKITEPRDYNESVYFYKHVQDAIFNQSKINTKEFISNYYEYIEQTGNYTINCKQGDFSLEVDGVSLRIFNTNVGILSFNVCNTKYTKPNDILAINDFGRRIYPQFLGKEYTKETKNSILAYCLTLKLGEEEAVSENFESFNTIDDLSPTPKLPNFIDNLIGGIRPIIDDRMFVISQYNNDNLTKELSYFKDDKTYSYMCNDWWYEYLFVDGNGKTCQSKIMTKKLVEKSTYDRWVDFGTLFGISRYSFVAVTGSWYGKEVLLPHMQTIYFQMFTILLSYRASIIKFSDDIQNLTSRTDSEIRNDTPELYSRYLKFINKLYFKEVTAQDQGIELYQKAMKILEIDKYMLDLDREMNELHSYVAMIDEQEQLKQSEDREKRLETISKLGAVFLPPSLLAGIYGINVFNFNKSEETLCVALVVIILSAIIGYISISGEKWKYYGKPILASILMFVVMSGFLYTIREGKTTPPVNISNPVVREVKEDSNFIKKLQSCAEKVMMLSKPKGEE